MSKYVLLKVIYPEEAYADKSPAQVVADFLANPKAFQTELVPTEAISKLVENFEQASLDSKKEPQE